MIHKVTIIINNVKYKIKEGTKVSGLHKIYTLKPECYQIQRYMKCFNPTTNECYKAWFPVKYMDMELADGQVYRFLDTT